MQISSVAKLQSQRTTPSFDEEVINRFKSGVSLEPEDTKIVLNLDPYRPNSPEPSRLCAIQNLALPCIDDRRHYRPSYSLAQLKRVIQLHQSPAPEKHVMPGWHTKYNRSRIKDRFLKVKPEKGATDKSTGKVWSKSKLYQYYEFF